MDGRSACPFRAPGGPWLSGQKLSSVRGPPSLAPLPSDRRDGRRSRGRAKSPDPEGLCGFLFKQESCHSIPTKQGAARLLDYLQGQGASYLWFLLKQLFQKKLLTFRKDFSSS